MENGSSERVSLTGRLCLLLILLGALIGAALTTLTACNTPAYAGGSYEVISSAYLDVLDSEGAAVWEFRVPEGSRFVVVETQRGVAIARAGA